MQYFLLILSEWLYAAAIFLYAFLLKIVAIRNYKARLMIQGRKGWQKKLIEFASQNTKPVFWMHVASLGEFEQGRPIIERIYQDYCQNFRIVLTFFSPSGYEIRKNYPLADVVMYLPFDLPHHANYFIETLQPNFVVFVKYDLWYFHLSQVFARKIPAFLISARFRQNQIFFHPLGVLFRNMLKGFDTIFVQDYISKITVSKIHSHVHQAGDTRFDRVFSVYQHRKTIDRIQTFKANHKILVCGSTWNADLDVLMPLLRSDAWRSKYNLKIIVVPHDVTPENIAYTIQACGGKAARYTEVQGEDTPFLVVDTVGMLSSIYAYADLAYIGGGFGKAVHNTLEAAVYGIPICFGPTYKKFTEAVELKEGGAAQSITNTFQFQVWIEHMLSDNTLYQKASSVSKNYVLERIGATDVIMRYWKKNYPEYFTP